MMKNIHIIEGDITKAKVDAIVNAANPAMLGGGGVDGAIHRAAGPALLDACLKVEAVNSVRCPFGEARITPAGDLPVKFVIHTAGPIYDREPDPAHILKASYCNSLDLAIGNGCQSVAFPAISCGVYGYPHGEAATIALSSCANPKYANLQIHFYLHGVSMFMLWQQVFTKLQERLDEAN